MSARPGRPASRPWSGRGPGWPLIGLALLGGHVGWSAHLLSGYALAGPACAGSGLALAALVGVTLASAALVGAAALASLRLTRPDPAGPSARRDRVLGRVGLLLCAVEAYAILLGAGGLLLVRTC